MNSVSVCRVPLVASVPLAWENVAATVDHGDKNKKHFFRTLSNVVSPWTTLRNHNGEKFFAPIFGKMGRPSGPWLIVVFSSVCSTG